MPYNSITSANAVFSLSISGLFDAPFYLQGFSADDIFTTDVMVSAETLMGVDGYLSAGFVYVPAVQSINLQADSESNEIFDQWWQAQQNAKDIYWADGVVILTSINKKYALTKGALTNFPPISDAARTLRPRRYTITWERVQPANIA